MRYGVGLFLLLMTVHSYAMLVNEDSFFKKPKIERPRIERVVRQKKCLNMQKEFQGLPAKNIVDVSKDAITIHNFVNNFPSITWNDAGNMYWKLSDIARKKIIQKIDVIDEKKENKLFSTAFYMATQLPLETRKKIFNECLFYFDGDKPNELIEGRPIGESLYRRELAWNMVRCKSLMRLPVCWGVLDSHGLKSSYGDYVRSRDDGQFVRLSKDGQYIISTFFSSQSYMSKKGRRYEILVPFEGELVGEEEAQAISHSFMQRLAWCAQDDIQVMFSLLDKSNKQERTWSKQDLERLVGFYKKYPSLGNFRGYFFYRINRNYQYLYFVKEGAKWGAMIGFPFWLVTLGVPALSRLIETRFCEKKVFADVAVNNELYAGAAELLDKYFREIAENSEKMVCDSAIAINRSLCEHIRGFVQDSVQYKWYEKLATSASGVIWLLLSWVAFVEIHWAYCSAKNVSNGSFITVYCVNAILFLLFKGIEDQALFIPSLVGLTACSMALGVVMRVYNKILLDKGDVEKTYCKLSEIEEQLKRKDIEIL